MAKRPATSAKRSPTASSPMVYELLVALVEGPITRSFVRRNKVVTRTIEIRGDQTLEQFHLAIFDSFDRSEEHMYEFQLGGKGPHDPKARRYVLPMAYEMDATGQSPAGDVTTRIDELGLKVDDIFGYWFDFGDDWWHQIEVLSIKENPASGKYPRLTQRVGQSPPQYPDLDEEEDEEEDDEAEDEADQQKGLAIIGAGNMAEAIVRGVLAKKLVPASSIIASDVSAERREFFESQLEVKAVEDNLEAARDAEVLLLSIKPQMAQKVLRELGRVVTEQTLIISIMAGIGSGFIEKHLDGGKKWRVIRTMPNTPMLLGEGMVAMARGANATDADLQTARTLFEAAATVIEVSEDKMDAVTAVSGSGPAYFFYLVEQMVQAGVELGLSPQEAHTLATKTALGAGKMLATSSDSPADLRRKVTSPNGTTHAAITHLEQAGAGKQMVDAVKAAARRSKELGM